MTSSPVSIPSNRVSRFSWFLTAALLCYSAQAAQAPDKEANAEHPPLNMAQATSVPVQKPSSKTISPSHNTPAHDIVAGADRCEREADLAKRINKLLGECETQRDRCLSPSLNLQKRIDQALFEQQRLVAENQSLKEEIKRLKVKHLAETTQNKPVPTILSESALEHFRELWAKNATEAELLESGRALREQGLPGEAASVYRQIARRHDSSEAMRRMGEIYDPRPLFPERHGQMDTPVPEQAIRWYRKAEGKGDEIARGHLRKLRDWARSKPGGDAQARETLEYPEK
uniref:Sel1 repeat-containing protein n=1 Tax=Candidatus Kentrum sp. DK TaxID=2126562 RepID=A0A450RVY3_9GAMM|nr:MAG: hypothetical protein BECKDK2373B_GA0170837_100513 [Candidatus Kentron sp. DK]